MGGAKERVGEIAVRFGFTTQSQIEQALRRQKDIQKVEGAKRLLGLVLLEMGIISTGQLIVLLKELRRQAQQKD